MMTSTTGTVLIMMVFAVCLATGLDFLTFCDGTTVRCVDLRPESNCVPVILCFLNALPVPPPFSLNNGDYISFSAVKQFNKSESNVTSANICILHDAFEDDFLEMRVKIQASGTTTTSNPVTLHANPGSEQQCFIMPEVYNSDIVLVNVMVDSGHTCFQAGNITCNATASSRRERTPQPVSYPLGHSSFNFTGFTLCVNYSLRCCILHKGNEPAVCEASIEEFMRPLPPNILKAEIMPNAGGLHLTVTLEAQKYFCSKAGKFVAEVLTESNSTVATWKMAEVKEKKHNQVLSYMFSPGVSVQQGNPLTVVMTAVDDDNSQNYRNSTSSSREIQWVINTSKGKQWVNSPKESNGWLPWLSLIPIAIVFGAFVVAAVIKIACKFCKRPANPQKTSSPVAEQCQDNSSVTVNEQGQRMKFMKEIEEYSVVVNEQADSTVVNDQSKMRSRPVQVVSRYQENQVEREKGIPKSALRDEQLFVHSVEPPTSADQKKKPISSVQASETGTTSGPCYTVPELPPAANKEVKL